jgi:hypothetical protein
MPYGSKKKPGSVAAGIAGGSKKAENNRVANIAALVSACAPALGRAFASANNAVVMTSGAAHDGGSPNYSGGGSNASQTSGHVADSNARRFPFNTSCDRASPTAAMPVSSASAASQTVANRGARAMRRDTAASTAALVTEQSVSARQKAAFNAGCGAATVASLGTTAGCSSASAFAGAQNASPSCALWSADSQPGLGYRGKVRMHILCYDLPLSILYLTKGYSLRPWTVGTPPSYTVPLIYISTPLFESVVSLIECW